MAKPITFANLDEATNEELYELIATTVTSHGLREVDPVSAELAIDKKVIECEAYCMNTEQMRSEYARYKSCDFQPYDPAMMFCNIDVLNVLRQHAVGDELPDPKTVLVAYRKELRNDYRERLKHVALEILKMDVPASDRVKLDLVTMQEADDQLNVFLEQFEQLLEVIDHNDHLIARALANEAQSPKPPTHVERQAAARQVKIKYFVDDEIELLRAADALNKKYAFANLAQDPAALKILYEQLRQQNAILDRLGKPQSEVPAPPRSQIYNVTLEKHLERLNRMLFTRDKIKATDSKVRAIFTNDIGNRQSLLRKWEEAARKRPPTKVTHIFSDVQGVSSDVRTEVDRAVTNAVGVLSNAAQATKDMAAEMGDDLAAKRDAAVAECNKVIQEAKDISADVKDIYDEMWYNPVTAVMKIVALAKNLWQIYQDCRDAVNEKTSRVTDKFAAAQNKAEKLFKPLVNAVNLLVEKVSDLIPAIKKYRFKTQANELRSTKRRRQNPDRYI